MDSIEGSEEEYYSDSIGGDDSFEEEEYYSDSAGGDEDDDNGSEEEGYSPVADPSVNVGEILAKIQSTPLPKAPSSIRPIIPPPTRPGSVPAPMPSLQPSSPFKPAEQSKPPATAPTSIPTMEPISPSVPVSPREVPPLPSSPKEKEERAETVESVETVESAESSDLYNPNTVFQFYFRSSEKPKPGKGSGEKIPDGDKARFTDLASMKGWRRVLSDFATTPFVLDGHRWKGVEWYYQGSKFKKNNPEFYLQFSLDSGSEMSEDPALAKAAGGKTGKYKGRKVRDTKIVVDPDFFGPEQRNRVEMRAAQKAKYTQNEEARKILLATKDAKLVHYVRGSPPQVFNDVMEIRKELQTGAIVPEPTEVVSEPTEPTEEVVSQVETAPEPEKPKGALEIVKERVREREKEEQKETTLDSLLVKDDTESETFFVMRSSYSRIAMSVFKDQINPATAILIGRMGANKAMYGVVYPAASDNVIRYIDSQILTM